MRLTDINVDGRIAAALWIAECAIQVIDAQGEYYLFCRETIDLCWEWFVNRKVDRWDIYDRITYDEVNLLDIVINTDKKDTHLSDKFDMILVSVTYVDWQAFNYDDEAYGYPEDLNEMSDEEFERVINIWIEKKLINHAKYESLLRDLRENDCTSNRLAIKERVMELVHEQIYPNN